MYWGSELTLSCTPNSIRHLSCRSPADSLHPSRNPWLSPTPYDRTYTSSLFTPAAFACSLHLHNPHNHHCVSHAQKTRPFTNQPSGPIESTHCLYETVESLNSQLFPSLHSLVDYPFFRHYKVDLFRECPFWYENGFCMNRNCGVEPANEVSRWCQLAWLYRYHVSVSRIIQLVCLR